MGFLLKRNKIALAGWSDDFNRPNESVAQPPWRFWGNVADFSLVDNRLKLAAEGQSRSGNYDGGIAFEHQPLTPNWSLEFVRAPIGTTAVNSSNETTQQIFLDRNWTEGGNASSSPYQVIIELDSDYNREEKDEEGKVTKRASMDYNVNIRTRDKTNATTSWGFTTYGSIGADYAVIGASEWAAAMHLRFDIFSDRYIIGYINGIQRLFADMYAETFRFGSRRRSANFAQISGLVASIDNFKTYDIPPTRQSPIRDNWTSRFFDNFDRENSTTVGNGWTQSAGNNFGIHQGSVSMNGGTFTGTDGFRQIRRDTGSSDMKVEFVYGGSGNGAPSLLAKTGVLGRVSADGSRGLIAYFAETSFWLGGFQWGGTLTAPDLLPNTPFFSSVFQTKLKTGVRYSLEISGDGMWIRNLDESGRIVQYRGGINAIQPPSPNNTWAGVFISRYAFTNSTDIAEMRIHT
nr:hypothetical protein [Rhodococcus sp. (in: high G+C Gram-positive bacteria)]